LIRGAIAHGDDHVPPCLLGVCVEQTSADDVFVDPASLMASSFEFPECRSEETGLTNEPFRSSIVFGARLQSSERQTFEVVHRLLMPLQRIEEFERGANQSRPDAKRRLHTCIDSGGAGNGEERFPFLNGERRHVVRCPLEQSIVQLCSRDHVGKNCCGGLVQAVFNRTQQVMRCRARRHDDEPIAGVERRTLCRKRRQDASKRPEVRRPHESSRAGCDH
jgi:hypothetical protein